MTEGLCLDRQSKMYRSHGIDEHDALLIEGPCALLKSPSIQDEPDARVSLLGRDQRLGDRGRTEQGTNALAGHVA
jgi:hypothetical protein